jgi:two-component system, NtrC family, response regulator AtoC
LLYSGAPRRALDGDVQLGLARMPFETPRTIGRLGAWNAVPPDNVLFGASRAMAEVHNQARRVCRANIPVLLTGEGGTGKEAVARWMHANSEYANGEFVKVSCAAIPGALLESELFGYERGAFTGATHSKPGRVELAHHGTLFLDEIVELDLTLQSKLLHFLQDGTFSRIGDHAERKIDLRLLCATNKDLRVEASAGRFRQDLYYRIHGFRLGLPPLRERREDIPVIAEFFRQHFRSQFGIDREPFSPEMLAYLQNRQWPGNIRELSNAVARYVLIGLDGMVEPESNARKSRTKIAIDPHGPPVKLKCVAKEAIKDLERNVILETLRANQWNRRKTAQALKISYRALIYKIQGAGLASRRGAARCSEARSEMREGIASDH